MTSERPAEPGDVAAITALSAEVFEGYRTFAGPGWDPPDVEREAETLRRRLSAPDNWVRVSVDEGEVVAVCGFAAAEPRPNLVTPHEGTAHVWAVFVTRSHWGTGVAARLLGAAVQEMQARGFRRARLVTPEGQARARRFYLREGWREVAPPFYEPLLALSLVEFAREW